MLEQQEGDLAIAYVIQSLVAIMVLNGLVGFYPLAGGRVRIIRYLYQKNVRPSLSLCDKTVRVHWFLPCVCGLFAPTHLLVACC